MKRSMYLAAIMLLMTPWIHAQQPGPGGPDMPPHPGMEMHHEGFDRGFGMMGMWWKNPETAKAIALTPDQQKKIEDLFLQSRVQLIQMHASLELEQLLLEPLLNANPVDQTKALAQINKIADTRADLEKANAKMLLSIRGVLTADQWTKLQTLHHMHRDMDRPGPDGFRGPKSRRGPGPKSNPTPNNSDDAAPAPAPAPAQ